MLFRHREARLQQAGQRHNWRYQQHGSSREQHNNINSQSSLRYIIQTPFILDSENIQCCALTSFTSMESYSVHKVIGEGSFGRALLVQCKKTQEKYALKEIQLPKVYKKTCAVFVYSNRMGICVL